MIKRNIYTLLGMIYTNQLCYIPFRVYFTMLKACDIQNDQMSYT